MIMCVKRKTESVQKNLLHLDIWSSRIYKTYIFNSISQQNTHTHKRICMYYTYPTRRNIKFISSTLAGSVKRKRCVFGLKCNKEALTNAEAHKHTHTTYGSKDYWLIKFKKYILFQQEIGFFCIKINSNNIKLERERTKMKNYH